MPATLGISLSGSPLSLSSCHQASISSPTHACAIPTQRNTHKWPNQARPCTPRTCQTRGERVRTTSWTHRCTPSPGRSRPSFPLSSCTRTLHHTRTLLDNHLGSQRTRRRRHDRRPAAPVLPVHPVARAPQTII
jgi:hypothetical protein